TMEEVWKDINLGSLHDNTSREDLPMTPSVHHNHPHNPQFILQDFFARPFNKDPPIGISSNGERTFYGSPLSPPATVLRLNSGHGFDFLDNSDPLRPNSQLRCHHSLSNVSSFNSPLEALASSSGLASFGKKRVQESDGSSGDRRHKRMIKNRESAARSRARKQECYTNELEHEVAQLMEENARLKRQQEQLRLAAAAQLPKKHMLHRTSTAPF
ncbi:LOW QUALITY PROTEIN: bZIP_2 domain-containing protein, partial [Cephalotus follicularis]